MGGCRAVRNHHHQPSCRRRTERVVCVVVNGEVVSLSTTESRACAARSAVYVQHAIHAVRMGGAGAVPPPLRHSPSSVPTH